MHIEWKLDKVMEIVQKELNLTTVSSMEEEEVYIPDIPADFKLEEDVYLIPFDKEGKPSSEEKTVWDLRIGKKIGITGGVLCWGYWSDY